MDADIETAISSRFGIINSMPARLAEIGVAQDALQEVVLRFDEISGELGALLLAETILFDASSESGESSRYLEDCRTAAQPNPAIFRELPRAEQFDGIDIFPTWNCERILSRIERIREIATLSCPEEAMNANVNLDRFVRRIRTEWLYQARRLQSLQSDGDSASHA